MNKWKKIFLGVSLSLMCIFTSVGYAELSNTLIINGSTQVEPPNAIFIVSISNVQESGVSFNTEPLSIGFPSTKVMSDIVFEGNGSTVSFDVLIKNNTQVSQYFDVLYEYPELEGTGDSFTYTNVEWTVDIAQGTEIASGESALFNVTLRYTGSNSAQARKMLHEFKFALNSDELTEIVSQGITERFEDILNKELTESITYTYDDNGTLVTETVEPGDTYDAVIENMNGSNSWFSSGKYIGNLAGAENKDKALLAALFGETLKFPIDGVEREITIMIKNKYVIDSRWDSNAKRDMVLYITADTLEAVSTYVPVYAVVFTENDEGLWEQVGDIYAGEARTNAYSGSSGSGSFDTETWRSTEAYYGVASESSIEDVTKGYLNSQ